MLEEPRRSSPKYSHGQDLISEIQPASYRPGRLLPGSAVYVDSATVFADVPDELLNLRCIKTANADRAEKNALSFQLDGAAKVYVGHDQRIRKKPGWLQAFSSTGKHLTLLERDGGEQPANQIAQEYVDTSVALDKEPDQKSLRRLQSASSAATRLQSIVQGGKNQLAVFDLFARNYQAGQVALGANTEWNALTRLVRVGLPKKIGMYVVCVGPAR